MVRDSRSVSAVRGGLNANCDGRIGAAQTGGNFRGLQRRLSVPTGLITINAAVFIEGGHRLFLAENPPSRYSRSVGDSGCSRQEFRILQESGSDANSQTLLLV